MKLFRNTYLLLALLLFQFVFSQEQVRSKKQIQNLLRDAGVAFYDLEVENSLKLSKTALNAAHELNDDVLMAKAYNIIGLNFEEFYDINKAIGFYNKALYHAKLTDNDSIKDWINNSLGNVYTYRGIDFKKGINYYKEGLIYAQKINDPIEVLYTQLNILKVELSI